MIHMPRRSVTRFFIPLIDVLILLFCIFLLMEFNSESKADIETEKVAELADALELSEAERDACNKELRQFERDRPRLNKLAEMEAELKRLRALSLRSVQQQAYVRIIDVDGKDGTISFFDDRRANDQVIKITDADEAKRLIKRHEDESKGRQVYYYFLYPRTGKRFPTTAGQEQDYRDWFSGTANSLVKGGS